MAEFPDRARDVTPAAAHDDEAAHGAEDNVALLALVGLLQFESWTSARLVDEEVHVTAYGAPLVIRTRGGGFEIHRVSGDGVATVCGNAREVLKEIRGRRWKR